MTALRVTDHCVLRYLERAKGVDVEAIRSHIESLCAPAHQAGAVSIRAEGVQFKFSSIAVLTCLPVKQPHRHSPNYIPGTRAEQEDISDVSEIAV